MPAKKVLIIVENLPVPFDRRVWQEASVLHDAGYEVSIICPQRDDYPALRETLTGIHIYRHPKAMDADRALGYLLEYSTALFWEFYLAWVVLFEGGFDIIQACNPPDMIFLVGVFFKYLFGKKFIFDHHDLNPELYVAKFQKTDFFYKLLIFLERCTFKVADISIATNESFKKIAIERGGMNPDRVFIVRNGPDLNKMRIMPPDPQWKSGRKYLVGYMGVMGKQDGIDCLMRAIYHIVHELGRTDTHFILIGGGTELAPMQRYAAELKIQDYITFTGWISDQEMAARILNTADVCVVPDKVNEMNDKSTFIKTMDYMALAKPIVQFELSEGRVTAQQASLYAKANDEKDFAQKVIHLLDHEDLRKEMGQYGRNRAENELAWPRQFPRLLTAYASLA